jgi:DNA-binding NtrC family response regulator
VIVMDVCLPGLSGIETFRRIKQQQPRLPVIIMTGHATAEVAIEATKLGAVSYHLKPLDPEQMLEDIDEALEARELMERQVALDVEPAAAAGDALIGRGRRMQEVYRSIGRVAETEAAVLLLGETGTGKELVARAIYQHSRRAAAPLVIVNCVAIPEPLRESEFFGFEKGAFTGAGHRRIGKFEQAHGGTILLDEIGDMPLQVQAKLLRVLQEKAVERLGGN